MSLTKTTYSMISGAVGNVLDYGADNTGTNDSYSAFSAAISANKSVFIPAGTYKIGTTLSIPGVKLFGQGTQSVTLNYTGSGAAITPTGTEAANCHLEGFTLIGTSSATSGIFVTQSTSGIFRNIYIKSFTGSGVYGLDISGSLNNGVYYNLFENIDLSGNSYGIRVYSSDGATNGYRANSNTFINCSSNSSTSGYGLYLNYANGNTFVGLDTESNTTYGVYIDSTYENSFCGGYSENNTSGGIYLTTNAARVHYFGRRTIDTTTGTFTGIGNFFTSDNFSVQPNGNLFCGALQTAGNIQLQGTNITVNAGSTTPVGNVAAYMGSLYLQTNGSMWLKTSGLGTDNTGWTQVTIP